MGGGGERGWFEADWELCIKWSFVQCDEQISECMEIFIIMSEILSIYINI